MTKRDLFRILIKLVGLYGIGIIVLNIIKNLGFVFGIDINSSMLVLGVLFFSLVGIAIMIFITLKPDSIINLLKLDKGFDNSRFDIPIDFKAMVSLIVIFSAFYLFIDNIGLFVNNVIFNIYESQYSINNTYPAGKFVYQAINLIICGLLIFYYRPIADFIVTKGDKQPTEEIDNKE